MKQKVISIEILSNKTIPSGAVVYTIKDGRESYQFWETKKSDGKETKAFQGYKSFQLEEGMQIGVSYEEKAREWINQEGKPRTIIDRSVLWFMRPEDVVVQPDTIETRVELPFPDDSNARFEKMSNWAKKTEERVGLLEAEIKTLKGLRTLLVETMGKEAVELHESMGAEELKR